MGKVRRTDLRAVVGNIASATDVEQAYAVGRAAVEFAIAGKSAVMPAIRRLSDVPYRWEIVAAPLAEVANQEKLLPPDFISADGFGKSPRRRAAIWRRQSLAKPIRHLRMAYP